MKNILLKDEETYLVCLEFMNQKSFSSYPFELDIIGMHPVSHLADQYSIHKVTDDVKKWCFVIVKF